MIKLLLIVFAVAVVFSANYNITKTYSDGKSQVAGISAFASDKNPLILTDAGKSAVVRNNIGALIPKDVEVTIDGNKVKVEDKILVFLPDQAVKNTLASKVLSEVKGVNVEKTTLAQVNRIVNLEKQGETLGYKIEGYKKHKLGGLIPVSTNVRAFVSAENGQVVETEQSLLGRILNKIAP